MRLQIEKQQQKDTEPKRNRRIQFNEKRRIPFLLFFPESGLIISLSRFPDSFFSYFPHPCEFKLQQRYDKKINSYRFFLKNYNLFLSIVPLLLCIADALVITTRFTPASIARKAFSNFGIIPPCMTPCSLYCRNKS